MRFGCGHPMGPLALLDLIGLDSAYEILDTMFHQSRDHLHAPAPILKQLVTAGYLGRKTGRGLYTYAAANSPDIVDIGGGPRPPPREGRPGRAHGGGGAGAGGSPAGRGGGQGGGGG